MPEQELQRSVRSVRSVIANSFTEGHSTFYNPLTISPSTAIAFLLAPRLPPCSLALTSLVDFTLESHRLDFLISVPDTRRSACRPYHFTAISAQRDQLLAMSLIYSHT